MNKKHRQQDKADKAHVRWFPKNPPAGSRPQQLEFMILKATQKNAEVLIFYFDIPNKDFRNKVDFLRYKEWLYSQFPDVSSPLAKQLLDQKERQFAVKRKSNFVRKISGNASSVFIKALSYIRSQKEKEQFTEVWELKRQRERGQIIEKLVKDNQSNDRKKLEELKKTFSKVESDQLDYGIYNQRTANEILSEKIKLKNISPEDIAAGTKMHPATVYKHISNDLDVTREQAISYAKFFGMDPSEILFNDLKIPLQGEVDFHESSHNKPLAEPGDKIIFKPGEIRPITKDGREINEYVNCPRDIYRPDIRAVKIVSDPSPFTNHIIFYYQTPTRPKPNDLCIFIKQDVSFIKDLKQKQQIMLKTLQKADPIAEAGFQSSGADWTLYKDKDGVAYPPNDPKKEKLPIAVLDETINKKERKNTMNFLKKVDEATNIIKDIKKNQYFIGYYEELGEKINILNMDPNSLPGAEAFEPDVEAGDDGEPFYSGAPNPIDVIEDFKYILKDAKPDVIFPIVAIVDVAKLKKDDHRSDLIKKETQSANWAIRNRAFSQKDKADYVEVLKTFKDKDLLQGKMIENYKKMENHYEEIISQYKKIDSIWQKYIQDLKRDE